MMAINFVVTRTLRQSRKSRLKDFAWGFLTQFKEDTIMLQVEVSVVLL